MAQNGQKMVQIGWICPLRAVRDDSYPDLHFTIYTQVKTWEWRFADPPPGHNLWTVPKYIEYGVIQMSSVETYHFLTPGVRISFLWGGLGGLVGESEFALCVNLKKRTQKWMTPKGYSIWDPEGGD